MPQTFKGRFGLRSGLFALRTITKSFVERLVLAVSGVLARSRQNAAGNGYVKNAFQCESTTDSEQHRSSSRSNVPADQFQVALDGLRMEGFPREMTCSPTR
jgi:hypothetical protein